MTNNAHPNTTKKMEYGLLVQARSGRQAGSYLQTSKQCRQVSFLHGIPKVADKQGVAWGVVSLVGHWGIPNRTTTSRAATTTAQTTQYSRAGQK